MLTDNKFRFLDVNPESVVDDVLYVLDRWKNCESAVSRRRPTRIPSRRRPAAMVPGTWPWSRPG